MTSEMGKTFKAAKAEVDKCIAHINYYIKNTEKILEDEKVES